MPIAELWSISFHVGSMDHSVT